MAKKKAKKKKATKRSAKKSLKLRKKPLRDLPAKKKVKGGDATLSLSQQAALTSLQPKTALTPQPTFAPPYVPVQPGLQTPRPY
jgi:hypothetical protein